MTSQNLGLLANIRPLPLYLKIRQDAFLLETCKILQDSLTRSCKYLLFVKTLQGDEQDFIHGYLF
jgi:hypothetical protein